MSADWTTLVLVAAAHSIGIPTVCEITLEGSDDPIALRAQKGGWLKLRILKMSDVVVGMSPRLTDLAVAGGIEPHRCRVIPNAVNLSQFDRREYRGDIGVWDLETGRDDSAFVVLGVGAVRPRKGFDRFIRVIARLRDCGLEVTGVIVGPIDKDVETMAHKKELEVRADRLGVGDAIVFGGRQENIAAWMAAADVFLFTSRREGFGTVLVEAMASRVPAVTFRLVGISEYIIGDSGGAVIVDTIDQATAEIAKLLGDLDCAATLAERGRSRARKAFGLTKIVSKYEALYRFVIGQLGN